MLLQLATWQEIDHYLEKSQGIIVPIGSTEQHGPKGLLGTDALCPEIIAHGLSDFPDILTAPTINFGVAQHHLGFAGSIALKPSTLIAIVTDVVASLMKHGFKQIYFLNGHGGNIATLEAAFAEIYHDISIQRQQPAGQPKLHLRNWWEFPKIQKLSKQHFGESEGRHATPAEISLTYYAYPNSIKTTRVSPDIAPTGPIRDAFDFRERFPDGRVISNSNLADPKIGEQLFHAACEDLVTDYEQFLSDNDSHSAPCHETPSTRVMCTQE